MRSTASRRMAANRRAHRGSSLPHDARFRSAPIQDERRCGLPKYHLRWHAGVRPTAPQRRLPVGAWLRYAIGHVCDGACLRRQQENNDARDRPLRRRQGGQGRLGPVRRRVQSQHRRGPGQGRARQPLRDGAGDRGRAGGAAGMGRDQPAAARPRHVQVPRPRAEGVRQPRRAALLRARQGHRGFEGRHPARPRGGRVRLRHSQPHEGRILHEPPGPGSISIRCASRSASSPASRRSIFRR